MKLSVSLLFVFLFFTAAGVAQEKKDILLTIDGAPVYASEFKRVYKKNLDLVKDESQKSVDGYLDLFIDYKLKVAEAYNQGLHEDRSYLKEFREYQEQLSRYYIYEDNVTSDLVKEAYEREQFEINASHILISSAYVDRPEDTLKAYNKIKEIKERVAKGEDFETLARQYSTDPSVKENGGDLGYFSAFTMVYPFETAAYTTPVGEISDIVRTRFGYHILYVKDKRPREPKRTVSHIMMLDKSDSTRTFNPEERINEIYQLYTQGEDFEELAKKFSEDRGSATSGGTLRPMGKNELRYPIFSGVVFDLENVGDVSQPFKSELGWHIVRLDKIHTNPTFEEAKGELERRVKDGARSKIVTAAVTDQIKEKYGFSKNEAYMDFFDGYVNDSILVGKWDKRELTPEENQMLFTIGDRTFYFDDLATYMDEKQVRVTRIKTTKEAVAKLYDELEVDQVKQYYKDRLELEDPEYAAVISEYRDGLLIFNIMNKNVWQKAKEDTLQVKEYYEQHKQNFKWKQRIEGDILEMTSPEVAKEAQRLLRDTLSANAIKKRLNSDEKVKAIVSTGTFEIDATKLPKGYQPKLGVSEVYGSGTDFTVIRVRDILPPAIKEFEEVRGRVMSEYQTQLEKEWIQSLRDKYDVQVQKKTLKRLKKELDT